MRTAENYPHGRILDAMVAEIVMGLVACEYDGHRLDDFGSASCHAQPESPLDGFETPCYSTVLVDAFKVADRMEELGWKVELARIVTYSGVRYWEALFTGLDGQPACLGAADELPLAICRAALGAVSAQVTA